MGGCRMRMGWTKRVGITAAVVLLSSGTAWAGSWIERPEGWVYEEDGRLAAGWNRIDKIWYYMDTGTGLWQKEPAVNEENAPYLMENTMVRAGLYQDEKEDIEYRAVYSTKDTVEVCVGWEEKPGEFHTINIFNIDKRTGIAKSRVTKEEYEVY